MLFDYRVSVGLEVSHETESFNEDANSCMGLELSEDFERLRDEVNRGIEIVSDSNRMANFFLLLEDYILDQV